MDKISVCGTGAPGSTPGGSTTQEGFAQIPKTALSRALFLVRLNTFKIQNVLEPSQRMVLRDVLQVASWQSDLQFHRLLLQEGE